MSKVLIPAISRKEELQKLWYEKYYSKDMFFCDGGNYMYPLDIPENNEHNKYAYAVIDGDKVIGYISFYFIPQQREVRGFMIMSFDKGNPKFAVALYEIKKLILSFNPHRIEWRMVAGNPVEKHYDRILESYEEHGRKIKLKDTTIDMQGNYLDEYIYEIIMKG